MDSIVGKSVVVVTKDGQPVSIGRFQLEPSTTLEQSPRIELVFETEALTCRLRVSQSKITVLKGSWNGEAYRYELPADATVWTGVENLHSSQYEGRGSSET